jgi:hypothetical protein
VDVFGPFKTALPSLCVLSPFALDSNATDRLDFGRRLDRVRIVARQANSSHRAMCPSAWMRYTTCGKSRLCHKHVARPEALHMPNSCGSGTARLGCWHRYRKHRAKYDHTALTARCVSTLRRMATKWTSSTANLETTTRFGLTAPKLVHPC